MIHRIQHPEDVAWFLRHTRGFRGGYIAEFHVCRRHLFDETSRSDVLADTSVTVLIRYAVEEVAADRRQRVERLARLRLLGVSEFSFFEQEGAESGRIDALQVEVYHGRFRFWFDQYGEVYVVCDAAELEDVTWPGQLSPSDAPREWMFQAQAGELPTVEWLLAQLDRAEVPCVWRLGAPDGQCSNGFEWAGVLAPSRASEGRGTLSVQGYGPLAGQAFGVVLRSQAQDLAGRRLLALVAEILTGHFPGVGIGMPTNESLTSDPGS